MRTRQKHWGRQFERHTMVDRQCDPHKFGMHGICRRAQRKMAHPEVARYLTIAASAPHTPGSQTERHRVKQHAQNTRATFRSQFKLRKVQHLSTPTIDKHHSHRSKPQRTVGNHPNLEVPTMRVHRTVRNAVSNGPAEHSSEAPERPRRARGATQLLKTTVFNMGTATSTDKARISKCRQRDPTKTVWNAISNATQWSIDNATRKSSERSVFAAGRNVK